MCEKFYTLDMVRHEVLEPETSEKIHEFYLSACAKSIEIRNGEWILRRIDESEERFSDALSRRLQNVAFGKRLPKLEILEDHGTIKRSLI